MEDLILRKLKKNKPLSLYNNKSKLDLKRYNNTYTELGSTGLKYNGGYVSEEWLSNLQGSRGVKTYLEMADNDPIIGAVIFAYKNTIRQAVWKVNNVSDSKRDKEAGIFLQQNMNDMSHSWYDFITEVLSMLVFGWSWHEIVYKIRLGNNINPSKKSKYNDGRIGWRKIPIRAQETLQEWVFDDIDGSVKAMHQLDNNGKSAIIPIEKSLLFRTDTSKGNPEGRSLLRNSYTSWYYKKHIQELEAISVERSMVGLPKIEMPLQYFRQDATPEEKKLLEHLRLVVKSIRRDENEGLLLPSELDSEGNPTGIKFSLVSSPGNLGFDTNKIIQRYDQKITTSVLADFLMLGHDSVGSFALSNDKTNMFFISVNTILNQIKEVINTYAVPRLFNLNSFKINEFPEIDYEPIKKPDLNSLAAFLQAVKGKGAALINPDINTENTLREIASLPEIFNDK